MKKSVIVLFYFLFILGGCGESKDENMQKISEGFSASPSVSSSPSPSTTILPSPSISPETNKPEISETNKNDEVEKILKKGFRQFESKFYKFKMDYPSQYYYSGYDKVGDKVAVYKIADKPLEKDTSPVFVLQIDPKEIALLLPSLTKEELTENIFYGTYEESPAYLKKRELGGTFVLTGKEEFKVIMKEMINSVVELK